MRDDRRDASLGVRQSIPSSCCACHSVPVSLLLLLLLLLLWTRVVPRQRVALASAFAGTRESRAIKSVHRLLDLSVSVEALMTNGRLCCCSLTLTHTLSLSPFSSFSDSLDARHPLPAREVLPITLWKDGQRRRRQQGSLVRATQLCSPSLLLPSSLTRCLASKKRRETGSRAELLPALAKELREGERQALTPAAAAATGEMCLEH